MNRPSEETISQDIRQPRQKPRFHSQAEDQYPQSKDKVLSPRRTATVYDAVAGRISLNGFLKPSQLDSSTTSSSFSTRLRPEEVLLRRVNAPVEIPYDYYDADQKLSTTTQRLPDSALLKDIHAYVSDYYEVTTSMEGTYGEQKAAVDFKSFDETALLAMGILLEEVCKEALGENGDMVFSESTGYDRGLPRSSMSKYQVIGRVVPESVQEYRESESSDDDVPTREDARPKKRARRRYGDFDGT